jgi:hypothetical protein
MISFYERQRLGKRGRGRAVIMPGGADPGECASPGSASGYAGARLNRWVSGSIARIRAEMRAPTGQDC